MTSDGANRQVILPKLGMYDGDSELVEWLIADREPVTEGVPLFLLGTDKVEVEVMAEGDGWLVQQQPNGFIGPVGTVVGVIVTSADDLP